jgi:hypothetical protein
LSPVSIRNAIAAYVVESDARSGKARLDDKTPTCASRFKTIEHTAQRAEDAEKGKYS